MLCRSWLRSKATELFGIDLRSLALFRMGLALIVLGDLIFVRFPDLRAFYTDEGVLPRTLLLSQLARSRFSLFLLNGSVAFTLFLFFFIGLAGLCLLIGWRTRLSTFICWLLTVSLQVRNQIILSGGDEITRMLLFWSIFLPLGSLYSIDQRLRPSLRQLPPHHFSIATIALLLQVFLVYEIGVVFKIMTREWMNGTATYYALSTGYGTTAFGNFLLRFPSFLRIVTHLVLGYELIAPLLLFVPIRTGSTRLFIIFSFLVLQFTFGSSLILQVFPWVMCIAMFAFVPSQFWQKIGR